MPRILGRFPAGRSTASRFPEPGVPPVSADRIFIRGLVISTVIGVRSYERPIRQRLLLDLELEVDLASSAASDALADTVDYRILSERLQSHLGNGSYGLIERVAEEAARIVLEEKGVLAVRVVVEKPGAVRYTRTVGVEIERRRTH